MIKTEKALKILGSVSGERNGNQFRVLGHQSDMCVVLIYYKHMDDWKYLYSIRTLKGLKDYCKD